MKTYLWLGRLAVGGVLPIPAAPCTASTGNVNGTGTTLNRLIPGDHPAGGQFADANALPDSPVFRGHPAVTI